MARMTRRQMTALLVVAPALAQTPPPAAPQFVPAPRTVAEADDQVHKAGLKLQSLNVPMDTAPAFIFKV